MRQVWIDSDAGFDDLLAVQMVACAPDVVVAGISLVAGNARLPQVVDNARRMAATFDWPFPIYAGAAKPLAQDMETAACVLGPRGMKTKGGWYGTAQADLQTESAGDAMAAWLSGLPAPSAILTLGPLTNLARLLRARPALRDRISELVIMGGSTDRGNSTAVAEFNIYADPEAAAEVFASGVMVRMVGINVCRQVTLVPGDVQLLRDQGSPRHDLLADLAAGYLSIRDAACTQPMPLYDPVAAAALLAPERFHWEPAHVTVELDGSLTRGMTVCEFRVPKKNRANTLVAMQAEAQPIRQMIFASLGVDSLEL